jgi:hypothetical protein
MCRFNPCTCPSSLKLKQPSSCLHVNGYCECQLCRFHDEMAYDIKSQSKKLGSFETSSLHKSNLKPKTVLVPICINSLYKFRSVGQVFHQLTYLYVIAFRIDTTTKQGLCPKFSIKVEFAQLVTSIKGFLNV